MRHFNETSVLHSPHYHWDGFLHSILIPGLRVVFFILHITQFMFIGVDVMSTKENYLIVDSGGSAYGGELGRGFKQPYLSI